MSGVWCFNFGVGEAGRLKYLVAICVLTALENVFALCFGQESKRLGPGTLAVEHKACLLALLALLVIHDFPFEKARQTQTTQFPPPSF